MAKLKVLGRDQLRKKLRALPEAIKAQIRPAMEQGAQDIADAAIHLVPVDTGALKNSIDWTWGPPPRGSVGIGSVMQPGEEMDPKALLLISVYAGSEIAYYARWVEFGTRGAEGHTATPAQSFFFPAYRSLRRSVKNRITRAAIKAIRGVAHGGN